MDAIRAMNNVPEGFGYSTKIVNRNDNADQTRLGVQLGKVCISKGISVIEVADYFKVTRQAVYNWFLGKSEPHGDNKEKALDLIKRLTS